MALLSPNGAPVRVLLAWVDGAFELLISPKLIDELRRVLTYPKLASRIPSHEGTEMLDWLSRSATTVEDPSESPDTAADKDDDYLLAIAAAQKALLVTGDKVLLGMGDSLPVISPAQLLRSVTGDA
ncbi:MAG TPA: putative toxin-antitoxin system toxin component, PIN family [Solirubrobacteraceae bacterium]|jgi:putative PIN family toxin of toxin-antitoxin system|nr:putative toxin-antitoxin system toxin component, PIN family [Solirubrobacteraceae bacterium]